MIISQLSHIGVFEKKAPVNEKGLLVWNFSRKEGTYLEEYTDWEPCALSPNGKHLAIKIPCSHRGAYRTELVVVTLPDKNSLLATKDYFVYDVAFDQPGNKLLIVPDKKKPFCYDLVTQQSIAELPGKIRLYKGAADPQKDAFLVPSDQLKGTCYVFDFTSLQTETIKTGIDVLISRMKYLADGDRVYAITDANTLYCFDRTFSIVWTKDFNYLGKQGGRINSSDIFSTEDGKLLCVYSTATETNPWGAEYVIDSTTGEIVRQIENYQFRGRIGCNFFDNKVLLHTGKTMDLATAEVSEKPVI